MKTKIFLGGDVGGARYPCLHSLFGFKGLDVDPAHRLRRLKGIIEGEE